MRTPSLFKSFIFFGLIVDSSLFRTDSSFRNGFYISRLNIIDILYCRSFSGEKLVIGWGEVGGEVKER